MVLLGGPDVQCVMPPKADADDIERVIDISVDGIAALMIGSEDLHQAADLSLPRGRDRAD